MRIDHACAGDLKHLRDMWRTCFEDTPRYVQWHFDTRYRPEKTLVAYDGDEPAAALQLYDRRFSLRGNTLTCPFIVGACTLPQYRKQGIMGRLLRRVAEEYPIIALYPARTEFYRKYGWGTFADMYRRTMTVPGERKTEITSPAPYAVYLETVKRYSTALWSGEEEFNCFLEGEKLDGGQVLTAEDGCLVYTLKEDKIFSFYFGWGDSEKLCAGLAPAGTEAEILSPVAISESTAVPGGMVRINPFCLDGLMTDGQGEGNITLHDPLDLVSGHYRIAVVGGRYRVMPGDGGGVEMSMSEFSSLAAGYASAERESLNALFPRIECICPDRY